MNRNQRLAASEQRGRPAGAGPGWWASGKTHLTIGAVQFPRGAPVPDEVVNVIAPDRLRVLTSNGLLVWRLGVPPADAPQPRLVVQEDAAAQRDQQIAALRRDGVPMWLIDHRVPVPAGAWLTKHPGDLTRISRHDAGGDRALAAPGPAPARATPPPAPPPRADVPKTPVRHALAKAPSRDAEPNGPIDDQIRKRR